MRFCDPCALLPVDDARCFFEPPLQGYSKLRTEEHSRSLSFRHQRMVSSRVLAIWTFEITLSLFGNKNSLNSISYLTMKCSILFLAAIGSAAAFTSNPTGRQSTELFGGADKYATSLKGKMERVETVKTLLDESQLIFTIPGGAISVKQAQVLRRSLPEGTIMSTIKNKLMARAVEGTDYEVATSLLKGPNNWFFIKEDIGGTIKAYNAFLKEFQKRETHPITGGVIEGQAYDGLGIEEIGKLPTKLELYAKIAGSIKQIPTKVAIVIKAPNTKLARAIKLATMPEE